MKIYVVTDIVDGELSTVRTFTTYDKALAWFKQCVSDVINNEGYTKDTVAKLMAKAVLTEKFSRDRGFDDSEYAITNSTELTTTDTDMTS